MKRVVVVGKTDCTINLNKIGVPVRGKTTAILTINNIEQENELNSIIRANLLDVIETIDDNVFKVDCSAERIYPSKEEIEEVTIKEEIKKKPGRPKLNTKDTENTKEEKIPRKPGRPPKNKDIDSLAIEEAKRVKEAEDKTQRRGAKVTLITKDGIKKEKMTDSLVYDISKNPEITKESINAIEKLEKEELENSKKDDYKVNFIDEAKDDTDSNIIIDSKEDEDNDDSFIEI
jgi:hypothetical protein